MSHLKVYRSATRELLMLTAGLLLAVAALDIVWLHRVSGPPEVDEATQALTSQGRSDQRTDLIWGGAFLFVGGVLVVLGAGGLVWRRPVVQVNEDDLVLRIAGPQRNVSIPWQNVSWVHSGSDGEDEAVPPRVLLVHVFDRTDLPDSLWGGTWDGSTLMIDAGSWSLPAVEVVTHARMALDAWRRDAAAPGEAEAVDTT